MTLDEFLKSQDIPGISGVDTRAITRKLRTRGVMMGVIAIDESPEGALARLQDLPGYDEVDFVRQVTTPSAYDWDRPLYGQQAPEKKYHVVISDCGLKYNILRMLRSRGCAVTAVPATTPAQDILDLKPDGIMLSPGPGDPEHLDYAVDAAKGLIGKVPIFGICLGNQVLGRAFGGKTFKLKFGHRGANHPVQDIATGRVHITSQNHGYTVDADSLPPDVEVSHINLNDNTVEGLRHKSLPVMSIQYHSEASPGPLDNAYMFDRFIDMIRDAKK
jgi:carbamoyl-phosphate synthase small subunit